MHLRICEFFKFIGSANPQIPNPQIATFAESKKMKFANLRICVLRNLFANSPPLIATFAKGPQI